MGGQTPTRKGYCVDERQTGSLGERIAEALERSPYNQTTLAKHLETTSQVVNKWLRQGVTPEGRYLLALPDLLGVSGHWLLTGEGEMVPAPLGERERAYLEIKEIVERTELATGPGSAEDNARRAQRTARIGEPRPSRGRRRAGGNGNTPE